MDDPGYNAFATPGGFIFVTKGLIDQLTDESELAGILAHEITHVVNKHHLKAMQKTARAGLLGKGNWLEKPPTISFLSWDATTLPSKPALAVFCMAFR